MEKKFRWGIIGGGRISAEFAAGLSVLDNACVAALASASGSNSHNIKAEKYYSDYQALVNDDSIDAVYIGNIHPLHYESAKQCLAGGKPVLCEKPVTMNAAQCRELVALSEQNKVFFMEAMWTRFLPLNRRVSDICQNQTYGKLRSVSISFGFDAPPQARRMHEAKLGGGALLDVGIYGVSYANMVTGEHPFEIHSWARKNNEDVDLYTSIQLIYPSGVIADVTCAMDRQLRNEAYLIFEDAEIQIPNFWYPPEFYRYASDGRGKSKTETYAPEIAGNGYNYEAAEVMQCIAQNQLESDYMKHIDSIRIMETLDHIRRQSGIYGD